ncbi:MAG: hypothetical protein SFU99_15090 [Saprospiraceae bacterium]|nr:hypothetical protein [Saprospiraceae bacterium]
MIKNIELPETTRVWIYQSNQPFSDVKVPEIQKLVQDFAQQWISHNRQLRAHGDVLHNRFVILMVDESQADASGCSIDKSVYFLKNLQAEYGVDLFDRMRFSYLDGEAVKTVSREEFATLYAEGKINNETLVFDTLVNNKGDFDKAFIKPLKESWHKRMV